MGSSSRARLVVIKAELPLFDRFRLSIAVPNWPATRAARKRPEPGYPGLFPLLLADYSEH